jgi:lysophospholipase L1-like esterase
MATTTCIDEKGKAMVSEVELDETVEMMASAKHPYHHETIGRDIERIGPRVEQLVWPARVRNYRIFALTILVVVILAIATLPLAAAFAGNGIEHWVGTWSTALHPPNLGPPGLTNPGFNNQTLRQIVHASIGGDQVRVRLSTFGASALIVGAAHIALRDAGAAIVPGSDRTLTFSRQPSITIPPGALVVSDPVDLDVLARGDLAVSIFVPGSTGPATWHFVALQTSYVSPPGDFTASPVMPVDSTTLAWFWLAGSELMASKQTGAIVTFGDSITDGPGSTPDTNNRWPDHLTRRLVAQPGNHQMGVLNEGITGNRLLHDGLGPNGLARFDRDVLTQTGVTHVIVLLGNNDIWTSEVFPADFVTADQIIEGHRQLIRRAHGRGLKIYGGTLTPFAGFTPFGFTLSPATEAKRQAVNAWIRTSGEYDAVIDFDGVTRDPNFPTRLLPLYDSGDHLHPNNLGYEAMGNAIDLKLFKDGEGYFVNQQ